MAQFQFDVGDQEQGLGVDLGGSLGEFQRLRESMLAEQAPDQSSQGRHIAPRLQLQRSAGRSFGATASLISPVSRWRER